MVGKILRFVIYIVVWFGVAAAGLTLLSSLPELLSDLVALSGALSATAAVVLSGLGLIMTEPPDQRPGVQVEYGRHSTHFPVACLIVAMFTSLGFAGYLLMNLSGPPVDLRFIVTFSAVFGFIGLTAEGPRKIAVLSRALRRDVLTPEAVVLAGFLLLALMAVGLPAVVWG